MVFCFFYYPFLAHEVESNLYQSHTMLMVTFGTMDLMSSPDFKIEELGLIRSLLIKRQRMGRISNIIATLSKELEDRDITNDVVISGLEEQVITHSEFHTLEVPELIEKLSPTIQKFLAEWETLYDDIYETGMHLNSFDISSFLKGATQLHKLYISLFG